LNTNTSQIPVSQTLCIVVAGNATQQYIKFVKAAMQRKKNRQNRKQKKQNNVHPYCHYFRSVDLH